MKRNLLTKFVALALTGLMLLSVCGCSKSETSDTKDSDKKASVEDKNKTPASEDKAKPAEKKKLNVISWWDITKASSLQELKRTFEEKNTDLELEFTQIGEGYADKILTIIAGGGDVPDVMMLAMDQVPRFASAGAIMSLEKYASKEYKESLYPLVLDACTFNGEMYSAARDVTSMVMFLNKKMFEEANVPLPKADWTINDFLDTAKKLTKVDADGKPVQWGFYFAKYPDPLYDFLLLFGGDYASADGKKCLIGTEESKEGLQFAHDLIYKYKVCPTDGQAKQFGESGFAPIIAGKVAMTAGGLSRSNTFDNATPKVEYEIAPLPVGKKKITHAFVNTWALPKGAKNPELSWRVLEFFSGKEGQQIVLDQKMGLPASKGVNADNFLAAHPGNKHFIDSLEYAVPFRTLVYGSDFYDLVTKGLELLWLDQKNVDEAVAHIEEKATDILAGKN